MNRMVDADKLIEWVKKMRHRHDMERNGNLVWIEQNRVIDLINWVACGEDMKAFCKLKNERMKKSC